MFRSFVYLDTDKFYTYKRQIDGGKLEQQVRAYGWLRDGRLSGGRFVIVDCGLAAAGIDRALTLQKDHDWVEYCPHEMLEEHLNSMKIRNANHSVP